MTPEEAYDLRIAERGWDAEPTGHDYQQAAWLWLLGFRRWGSCGWRMRVLKMRGWRRGREAYTTLRTFEAFRRLERRILDENQP